MAVINHIVGTDLFQSIRDRIAVILLDELAGQFTLTDDSDLNLSEIWKERRRPFNLSELPAINLSIGGINYGDKKGKQRQPEVTYNIDIYNVKVFEDDSDADQTSMDTSWKVLRVIQYILDHPHYRDLQLSPYIYHTEASRVNAGEAEMSEGGRCAVLRLEVTVKTVSEFEPIAVTPLTLGATTVKIEQTDKGYYYALTNE